MPNRTLLLLQAIIAGCVWLLVVLASWAWIADLRVALATGAGEELASSTKIAAGLVLLLSISLLAITLERFYRFTQAPRQNDDG